MRGKANIAVIVPAFNEEKAIKKVISLIPAWIDDCIVVDNGSTDKTAAVAQANGARVVFESRRGYGSACLSGIQALQKPDLVVFLDGDCSDVPEEMDLLIDPILNGEADFVMGSRTLGVREPGALTPQARLGNWLACLLMKWFWGANYTDLGPFRAISFLSLKELGMVSRDYGWTVEMQIKAAQNKLRSLEVPVRYRRRIGSSKISGTWSGAIFAGTKILITIFTLAMAQPRKKREK